VYELDRVYRDECPKLAIAEGEYAVVTVVGSHHVDPHLLVGTCDDASLPDCTWHHCGKLEGTTRAPRDVCLPGRVYRKVYARRHGAGGPTPGEQFIVEPFCVKGACELGFALWVVRQDESIERRASCRLQVGQLRFEDRPRGTQGDEGDFESLRLKCEIHTRSGGEPPRECYPPY
jgi:hypothetical protein